MTPADATIWRETRRRFPSHAGDDGASPSNAGILIIVAWPQGLCRRGLRRLALALALLVAAPVAAKLLPGAGALVKASIHWLLGIRPAGTADSSGKSARLIENGSGKPNTTKSHNPSQ